MRGAVLVVEDDAALCALYAAVLSDAGYEVATALNGHEALRLAAENAPRVALLDIELPQLNGYEICRLLRESFGRSIGIAFITGTKTDLVDVSSGLLVGADDYLVKPVDPDELVARTGALLRRTHNETETASTGRRRLTARELHVLERLADGLDQRAIAHALSITDHTVARHIEHILSKLGVHSRSQAIAVAYRERLLQPAPNT